MISISKNHPLLRNYNSQKKEDLFIIANLLPSTVQKNKAEKIFIMNLKINMIYFRLMGIPCLKFWTEIPQLKEKMLKKWNKKKQIPINIQGCAVELNPWTHLQSETVNNSVPLKEYKTKMSKPTIMNWPLIKDLSIWKHRLWKNISTNPFLLSQGWKSAKLRKQPIACAAKNTNLIKKMKNKSKWLCSNTKREENK